MDKIIRKKFRIKNTLKPSPLCGRKGGTREVLAELFYDLGFAKGAEIGTHKGKYAEVLCSINRELKLYCIDPWLKYSNMHIKQDVQDMVYEEALTRLSNYNVEIIKTTSMNALGKFDDRFFDFVYIDGNHAEPYVSQDIDLWYKKVKPGGILAGHDYARIAARNGENSSNWAVIPAVHKFADKHGLKVIVWGLEASTLSKRCVHPRYLCI